MLEASVDTFNASSRFSSNESKTKVFMSTDNEMGIIQEAFKRKFMEKFLKLLDSLFNNFPINDAAHAYL